jgi:hypothetical protein
MKHFYTQNKSSLTSRKITCLTLYNISWFLLPSAEIPMPGGLPHSEQNLLLGVTMLSQGSPFGLIPVHIVAPGRKTLGSTRQPHSVQNLLELSILFPHWLGSLRPSSIVFGHGTVGVLAVAWVDTFCPHIGQKLSVSLSANPHSQSISFSICQNNTRINVLTTEYKNLVPDYDICTCCTSQWKSFSIYSSNTKVKGSKIQVPMEKSCHKEYQSEISKPYNLPFKNYSQG